MGRQGSTQWFVIITSVTSPLIARTMVTRVGWEIMVTQMLEMRPTALRSEFDSQSCSTTAEGDREIGSSYGPQLQSES